MQWYRLDVSLLLFMHQGTYKLSKISFTPISLSLKSFLWINLRLTVTILRRWKRSKFKLDWSVCSAKTRFHQRPVYERKHINCG